MRAKLTKITLAAGFMLAITFTFNSCSGDDDKYKPEIGYCLYESYPIGYYNDRRPYTCVKMDLINCRNEQGNMYKGVRSDICPPGYSSPKVCYDPNSSHLQCFPIIADDDYCLDGKVIVDYNSTLCDGSRN